MDKLYLGVARAVITPKVGALLAGYSPDNVSTAVNDDLTATVFYFKNSKTEALLITATICAIIGRVTDELFSEVEKRYSIPRAACMLCSTHTHSGPIMLSSFGWGDIDVEYKDSIFLPRIIEAVGIAKENARPVKMAVGVGES